MVHAIRKEVKPIVTVNGNIACKPWCSIAATVSLLLAIKISPPEIRQKEVISSDGGRDGRYDDGGEMYVRM